MELQLHVGWQCRPYPSLHAIFSLCSNSALSCYFWLYFQLKCILAIYSSKVTLSALLLATVRQTCLNPLCCFISLQKLFALAFWCLKLCEHALTVMPSLILYSWKKYKWTFSLSVSDESLIIHCKYKTLNQIKNRIKALLFVNPLPAAQTSIHFFLFLSSFVYSIPTKWTVTGAEENLSSRGFYTVNRVEREYCFCCLRRLPYQGCEECCFFHLFFLVVHMRIYDNSKGVCECTDPLCSVYLLVTQFSFQKQVSKNKN